jgi:regulator of sirC expression with transglutaminase-like and TPR domain
MTFFFTRGADPALEQLERSLEIDPSHPRTLLSKGIVLWQGKQDLEGAAEAWQTLVALAPDSPEAQAAQQGLQAIAAGRQSAQSPSSNQ